MHTIETARIILRPFTEDDLDEFALMGSNPEVMRFIGDGKPQSRERSKSRLFSILKHTHEHGFGLWAAVDKSSGDLMGFCGLEFLDNTTEVEVGYRLAKRFWGKGLATEGAVASVRYGFAEMNLDRIVGVVHPKNFASSRVLEKAGLRYLKDAHFYGMDVKYYAITREEHQRLRLEAE